MPSHASALILLAKYPEPEQVKTRLVLGTAANGYSGLKDLTSADGKPVGKEQGYALAAELYRAFLTDRFRAHGRRVYDFALGTTQPDRIDAFRDITGPGVDLSLFENDTLGGIMRRVFVSFLKRYQKALISGSDFPFLDENIIERALNTLDTKDVVLVPAFDGAYNLIGMRRPHDIFTLSAWSSGSELGETIALLQRENISYSVLDDVRILDVDTLDDLRMLMISLSAEQAPATWTLLSKWLRILNFMD